MKKWLVLSVLSMCLSGCATNTHTLSSSSSELSIVKQPLTRSESLLHTAVQLQIFHEGQEEIMDEAVSYMQQMEKLLSTNLEGSDVYRINEQAGIAPVKVEKATFEIIKKALQMSERSHGKFDITIGAVTNLWKIGSEDARKPQDAEIQSALPKIDYHNVILSEKEQTVFLKEKGMVIELGGISKGYIANGVRDLFAKHGITTAIINLGGNVVVMGSSPSNDEGWRVGVQDPDEIRGEVIGAQRVINGTVVTSGIYERYLEVDGTKYHHILDPTTGYPLKSNISGVSTFTEDSMEADAYSTTLFLLGIEEGLAFVEKTPSLEAVFIDQSGGVYLSSGLKDTFELTNKEYHLEN